MRNAFLKISFLNCIQSTFLLKPISVITNSIWKAWISAYTFFSLFRPQKLEPLEPETLGCLFDQAFKSFFPRRLKNNNEVFGMQPEKRRVTFVHVDRKQLKNVTTEQTACIQNYEINCRIRNVRTML